MLASSMKLTFAEYSLQNSCQRRCKLGRKM